MVKNLNLNNYIKNKKSKKNCQGRVDSEVYELTVRNLVDDPRWDGLGDLLEALLRRYNDEMDVERANQQKTLE